MDFFTDDYLKAINTKFRKTDTKTMVFDGESNYEVVSTGSTVIDLTTGENIMGVMVKGRITEISGMESSGKTTLMLESTARAVKQGWVGAFIDMEGTYDVKYAKSLGLEEGKNFRVFRPTSAEDAEMLVNMMFGLGKGNSKFKMKLDFLLWDSVAATVPTSMLESETSTGQGSAKGEHARYWGNFIKKLNAIAMKQDVAIILINQLRNKIDMANVYQEKVISNDNGLAAGLSSDNSKITTGGTGLKYFLSLRILLQQTKRLKEEVVIRGKKENTKAKLNYIKVTVIKNKLGIPFKEGVTAIQFGKGFRDEKPMYDYLKDKTDVITTTSAGIYTFQFEDTEIAIKGLANFQKELFSKYLSELKEAYVYEKTAEYDELYDVDEDELLEDMLDDEELEELDLEELEEEEQKPKKKKKIIKKKKRG